MAGEVAAQREPTEKEIRLVIAASSAGTIFEWYDFFIYGTLAGLIGAAFFPSGNETLQILLVWAGFAVGFGFRPLGAILFGFLYQGGAELALWTSIPRELIVVIQALVILFTGALDNMVRMPLERLFLALRKKEA